MKSKYLLKLIGPVIFLGLIYFYIDLNELKNNIIDLKWLFFCVSVAINPLLIFLRSHRWRIILSQYDISYTEWECFKIYFVEMVAINIIAAVGTFAKAIYLKRDGYGLLRPILSIITEKYYDYMLPLIFGLVSVFLVLIKFDAYIGLVVFLFATSLAFFPARKAILLLAFPIFTKRIKGTFLKREWNVEEHLSKIHDALNFKIYIYSIAAFGLYFGAIYFLTKGLYLELSFFQVVLIMTITSLIAFLPISFFGIGTRDAGLVMVFNYFGHTPEQAVALSMVLLLLRIAVVFMGSIFWFIDPPPLEELKHMK
jgi:uncharacterized protein (TIRG00374 family)